MLGIRIWNKPLLDYSEIDSTAELVALVERVSSAPWIAVDTEFEREKTYYPNLCLIQVATSHEVALIDPLAKGIDLKPFFEILANPNIVKVFHAGRQDIEIFYHLAGEVPQSVFDSQIAAMVVGMGEAVGYETLVRKRLGIAIDKSCQTTNWKLRPLDKAQKDYAAADALHLAALYPALYDEIIRQGRLEWIADELAVLADPFTYHIKPEEAWQRVKGRVKGKKQFAALVKLAAWREEVARNRNIPRQRVLRDILLVEMANSLPKFATDVERMRSVSKNFSNSSTCKDALQALNGAVSFSMPERSADRGLTSRGDPGVIDLMKILLKSISEEHGVASKLIANNRDIEMLVLGERNNSPVLQGWRGDVFGRKAIDLLDGNLHLHINGGRLAFSQV